MWNAGLRQLYMSAYHLSPAAAVHYRDALVRYRVTYLWGYPSGLHALAEDLLARGLDVPGIKVIITNAEPLLEVQRSAIERAFGCPVVESYGMTEAVLSASQCLHGALHLWPESGDLEVVDGSHAVAAGEAGEFLATGLNNVDMPLIRYRTGDRGALAAAGVCACGRTLPRLARVEGRSDDVLFTPDGRRIGRLDPVFKAHFPIREAQLVQETLERMRVGYIPGSGVECGGGGGDHGSDPQPHGGGGGAFRACRADPASRKRKISVSYLPALSGEKQRNLQKIVANRRPVSFELSD